MAVLSAAERAAIFRYFMRVNTATCGFTKAQLQAAVDACDQWVDDNSTAFNTALPAAFRTNANQQQKALLLCWVAMRRVGLLRTEEDV